MQMNRRFYYSLGIRNFLRSFQFTFQLDNKQTNNMAAIPAVVAVAVLRNNRVARRQNINKEGCVENDFCSLRLTTPQIHLLVTEYGVYGVWWRQNEMVDSSQLACEKRIRVFLHYIARGGYYHQIGRAEGIANDAKSTAFQYLHDVAEFFRSTADGYGA